MAINETLYTGRKFRQCIDNTPGNKKWNVFSWWTKAKDVEFEDGTTAETKLGAFKGVTTNENQTAGYAADVTLLKSVKTHLSNLITSLTNLVNSINYRLGGLRFYEDSTGKYVVGADSVPKKLGSGLEYVTCIIKTKTRDISVGGTLVQDPSTGAWHEEGKKYGNVAEFDLTRLPGYQNCVLGEDIYVEINLLGSSQSGVNYGSYIPKKEQQNDPNFNFNQVKITDFVFEKEDAWISGGGEQKINGFCGARYVPATGKLYVITAHTATTEIIALFRA